MERQPDESAADRARPGRRGAWAALRPLVLRLHFYAGVFVAPFILVAAVSGLLYVWTPQIEQAVYAEQLYVEPDGAPLALHEQVRVARSELPGAELDAVRPATGDRDSTRVLFDLPGLAESHRMTVFVDPYGGEVLGTMQTYGTSGALPARTWVDMLHRNLHLGDAGRLYSELAASWLWAVALGGAALWVSASLRRRRSARRLLVPGAGAPPGRSRSVSVHGATGLWLLAGLLFLSATGMTWSQYAGANITELRERLAWSTPSVSAGTPNATPGVDAGIDTVLASARDAGLDGLVEVSVPRDPAAPYTVTQIDRSWPSSVDAASVAADTGEVVDVVRFADYPLMAKLSRWGIDAHMGVLFGVPNQLVLTALALGLVAVIVWGYRMWWQRRPTRTHALGVGRPYPRGAFRALSWPWRVAVAAVLAAIGWAVPLLGVSLLAFLAVDRVVGRRAGRPPRAAGGNPVSAGAAGAPATGSRPV
ncbi:PepSY-associated TM helix domain-containing protein [Nocardiopsis sp. CT-R113]|uniref:PepSY-associated TM helix domain-containing protein n=1 Tax=Nocardiopsis codii TaxID=3065942 RepID=A0ABU7K5A1_9ACTN|nr:PepSY-associated TM helix domain-containing protein [Nocardiopsis sp. CT-R113]MEE2037425.1 PepSY-associated TM helix domain-containing protein [Nocardiopsis sp. CT-R113]